MIQNEDMLVVAYDCHGLPKTVFYEGNLEEIANCGGDIVFREQAHNDIIIYDYLQDKYIAPTQSAVIGLLERYNKMDVIKKHFPQDYERLTNK
jgi:hypothetical protein